MRLLHLPISSRTGISGGNRSVVVISFSKSSCLSGFVVAVVILSSCLMCGGSSWASS